MGSNKKLGISLLILITFFLHLNGAEFKLLVDENGNVGINNDSPQERLDVQGNAIIDLLKLRSSGIINNPQAGDIIWDGNDFLGYDGLQWLSLTAVAQGETGPQGPAGADGTDGQPGIDGATGDQWTVNVSDYQSSDTLTYDLFFLDISTGNVHLKSAGNTLWALQGSILGPKGDQGTAGTNGTNGIDGANGSDGLQGPAGNDGSDGTPGIDGQDGDQWTTSVSDFSSNEILNYDYFYLDISNGNLHKKTSGNSDWVNLFSIMGQDGTNGADGAPGTDGTDGADGATGATGSQGDTGISGNSWLSGSGTPGASLGKDGDLYLDTASYDIYKNDSGWSQIGNIKGSTGASGNNGADGDTFFSNNSSNVTLTGSSFAVGTTSPTSNIHLEGSISFGFAKIVADGSDESYTLGNESVVIAQSNIGTITLNLPPLSGSIGREYRIRRIDDPSLGDSWLDSWEDVIIQADPGDKIGVTDNIILFMHGDSLSLLNDGERWQLIEDNRQPLAVHSYAGTNQVIPSSGANVSLSFGSSIFSNADMGGGSGNLKIRRYGLYEVTFQTGIDLGSSANTYVNYYLYGNYGSGENLMYHERKLISAPQTGSWGIFRSSFNRPLSDGLELRVEMNTELGSDVTLRGGLFDKNQYLNTFLSVIEKVRDHAFEN